MSRLVLSFTTSISIRRRGFRTTVKKIEPSSQLLWAHLLWLLFPLFSVASESFLWILQGSSQNEGKMMTSKSTGGGPEMCKPNRLIWANWPARCLARTDSLFSLCFLWAHLSGASRDTLCDLMAKTRRTWPAGYMGGPTYCLKGTAHYKKL